MLKRAHRRAMVGASSVVILLLAAAGENGQSPTAD
jgi:hypothetical protein